MMEELIRKYDELYEDMAMAKDPKKMMIFGDAEKKMFHSLAKAHPEIAESWLTKLEAGRWNNYLSKSEAEKITGDFINQDGSRGAHWPYMAFKAAIESLGVRMSDEPYYNCYALWTEVNSLWSDHNKSISEFIPKEKELKFYYMMAVEKLRDVDRPRFIREYFEDEL